MSPEDVAGRRDEMAILTDEREHLRAAVDHVVERILDFRARRNELSTRAEAAGEPCTVLPLARLDSFRREPGAALARFAGREN